MPLSLRRGTVSAVLDELDGLTRIEVDGEEDLAVMPAIIHLASGATVIYGLPNRGATLVKVGDESKRVAREFLESFQVVSS